MKAWAKIAQFLHMRNGKQCRERYRNHLRPELCKGEWSVEEDTEIWNRVREVGTKWAAISELFMPTRTDNDIKNRWNSIIRKPKAPGGREWTHRRPSSAWPSSATRRARRCPGGRPRAATLRAAAAAPPPTRRTRPPNAPRHADAHPPRALRRSARAPAHPGRERDGAAESSTSRARRADGVDDGEFRRAAAASSARRTRGRRRAAPSPRCAGAPAPNSESLRRYRRGRRRLGGDAGAGDGGGGGRRRRRRAPPRRCSGAAPRAPRRSWGRRAPSSARRAPSKSPPRPSTSARRSAAWARPSSTASLPPASSARPCRWRSRWGPTARRSRRRAAMGAGRRRVAVAPRPRFMELGRSPRPRAN